MGLCRSDLPVAIPFGLGSHQITQWITKAIEILSTDRIGRAIANLDRDPKAIEFLF